ncbi:MULTISPECIES: o-succinylbenzoate synthase [Weeksella]|uniref:o-succinylbenzoate synthase n=1 Tax=Weeksella TaxID=1013 RepID=UPI0008A549F9|nr:MULTISPECIES: o-succinylbenzoate synthase [Weeksella]OFM85333.1 o-succinylbenzoate synthase [Weeksella sp. HMSC059D05]SUP55050.1 L-Ala-D/L-Glu epimerase [Weeksella virosa]
MKVSYTPYVLQFKRPGGTSRGVLTEKLTYILKAEENNQVFLGECGLFKGLSADDVPEYETKLQWACNHFDKGLTFLWEELRGFPSIQFGLEQLFQSIRMNLDNPDYTDPYNPDLYESAFKNGEKGIPINGLIWMGDIDFMKKQIEEKLAQGFHCLKLKIGVNWKEEYKILKELREKYPANKLELRVDANGGFSFEEAKTVLRQLKELSIHSIEQPIKKGQIQEMKTLCVESPTPIALDEELIGVFHLDDKYALLQEIRPQYIILKPSLVGGVRGSLEWIDCCDALGIGFWITSALESNIGLNAIAQWTAILYPEMPQGLGTGGLFSNNFSSRLQVEKDQLYRKKIQNENN